MSVIERSYVLRTRSTQNIAFYYELHSYIYKVEMRRDYSLFEAWEKWYVLFTHYT